MVRMVKDDAFVRARDEPHRPHHGLLQFANNTQGGTNLPPVPHDIQLMTLSLPAARPKSRSTQRRRRLCTERCVSNIGGAQISPGLPTPVIPLYQQIYIGFAMLPGWFKRLARFLRVRFDDRCVFPALMFVSDACHVHTVM